MSRDARILTVKIPLTITALEFFGPVLRDYHPSHAFNPDWVGHARVHLVWLLGFMFLSGVANLYLIWFRRPFELRNLWLSAGWQSCNLGGFWIAYLLAPHYDGAITVPHIHTQVFGIDENVFAFSVLSLAMIAAVALLWRGVPPQTRP
ncbi:MAG: hypothetical protein JSU66_10990 [Deltaproteobacteria bacterium]|nr:MAG: hypothetical protein JSU66_10990 [Deltaproteobacteria bacterium]